MSNKFKLAFGIIIFAFIFLRVLGLGNDISNSDALRWHRRSENFLHAIKTGDLESTYQRYHPGVTLMWINAFTKQALFSYNYSFSEDAAANTLENSAYFSTIHQISKTVLVLVLTLLFIVQIYLISKTFNNLASILYGTLVVFEPFIVGMDRWFHLTALETSLVFTSFLAILCWKKIKKNNLVLIFAAVLYGLAFLTKTSSLIILPVLLVLIILPDKFEAFKKIKDIKFKELNVKPLIYFAVVQLFSDHL